MGPDLVALLPPLHAERRAALWFPLVLPSFNELEAARGRVYARTAAGRRSGYDDLKRRHQNDVAMFALAQKRRWFGLDFRPGLFIACDWREPTKKRDPDNIVGGGKKLLLDGLALGRVGSRGWTGAGVIHCDGQHCVSGFLDVITHDPKSPGVAVYIFEVAPAWAGPALMDFR